MTAETNAPGSKRFARTAHLLEIFRYEREKYKKRYYQRCNSIIGTVPYVNRGNACRR